MLHLALGTIAFVLLAPSLAGAATLCVNSGGTSGCFGSIQAAVGCQYQRSHRDRSRHVPG